MQPPQTTGRIVSVNISTETGTSKTPVPEIEITALGVAQDAHAGPGNRQVSMLSSESIDRFAANAGRTFSRGDFAENITTAGIDLSDTGLLDQFHIGEIRLEVAQLGKKCHGDGCAIFQEVGKCVMPREGIFCRVLQGGVAKENDPIIHVPRVLKCMVITLSDRAHQGVYADRSGPRVREHLDAFFVGKRWHPHIEQRVLPDDAELLRDTLITARDTGVDIVITTGGTGIGPRDITPDVVTALADRLIPGIMEYIRIQSAASKPNALLSRSVAAVLDKTLVYTLPGSVRAVTEYMDEILKTVEHVLYMLHDIDAH